MTGLLVGLAVGTAAGAAIAAVWGARRSRARSRELDEARRRLEAARGAATRFFDLTTHELRAPLSAILGYQELLHDRVYGRLPDEAADAVDRLGRAARHLLNLIDGVIELGRLHAGRLEIDPEPVDLTVVLSAAVEAFQRHAADRGITATVTPPQTLPTVRTDSKRLSRALDLLITSAVRHPADDAMDLRITTDSREVSLAIGPTDIEIDTASDDPAVRLGIRLAVTARVAELLGGTLDLTTEHDRIHALRLRLPTTPAAL